jgi:hypothetical protein
MKNLFFNRNQVDMNHINDVYPEGDINKLGIGFDGEKFLNLDLGDIFSSENIQNAGEIIKDVGIISAAVKPAATPTTPLKINTTTITQTAPVAATTTTKSSNTWIWVTIGGVAVIGTGLILFFTLKK